MLLWRFIGGSVTGAHTTYALTGTDANLTLAAAGKILAADAGSYALTGTDATLRHGWIIPAGAGSYVLTGTAANTVHGWLATADPGSYALTGTPATLTYQPLAPTVTTPTRGEWPEKKRSRSPDRIQAAREARESFRQSLERLYDGGDYNAPVEVLEEAQDEAIATVNALSLLPQLPLQELRVAEDLIRAIQELIRQRQLDEMAATIARQHLNETIDIATQVYRKTRFDYLARVALLTAE